MYFRLKVVHFRWLLRGGESVKTPGFDYTTDDYCGEELAWLSAVFHLINVTNEY